MRTTTLRGVASAVAVLGCVGALLWAERRHPLRRAADPGIPRLLRNVAIGALTAVEVALVEKPLIASIARAAERRRVGLLPRLALPRVVETALALAALDYTLYRWHVMLHRAPWLWRFHRAHHADLDLDASTAVRFHVGEFVASIPWRAAQVVLIGVRPRALALWQALTLLEVVFHHANARLPRWLDARVARVLVTPRLHAIHHSVADRERDMNFSSGLTLWDRLHRTLGSFGPRDAVTIGLPDCRSKRDVTLGATLRMPFVSGRRRRTCLP